MPFEGPGSPILPDMDTYSFDAEPDEPAAICGKMDGAFVEATFRRPCVCYIPGKGTATMVAPGRLITTTDIGSSDHEFDGLTARFNFRGMLSDQWVNVRLRPQDMFLVNEDIGYVLMACEVRGAPPSCAACRLHAIRASLRFSSPTRALCLFLHLTVYLSPLSSLSSPLLSSPLPHLDPCRCYRILRTSERP